MKLSQLKNGYIVVKASSKDDYRYVMPSDTNVLGVVRDGTIVMSGVVNVHIFGVVRSGQPVRARLSGERGSAGVAVGVLQRDSGPYLQIGIAMSSGRDGLVPVALSIRYIGGDDGLQGPPGPKGDKGDPGDAGYTPIKGVDYFDGEKGDPGEDGYTPVKGIDYFDGSKGDKGDPGSDATVTKSSVEAVLTGEITTHSHPGSGLSQAQILTRQL